MHYTGLFATYPVIQAVLVVCQGTNYREMAVSRASQRAEQLLRAFAHPSFGPRRCSDARACASVECPSLCHTALERLYMLPPHPWPHPSVLACAAAGASSRDTRGAGHRSVVAAHTGAWARGRGARTSLPRSAVVSEEWRSNVLAVCTHAQTAAGRASMPCPPGAALPPPPPPPPAAKAEAPPWPPPRRRGCAAPCVIKCRALQAGGRRSG